VNRANYNISIIYNSMSGLGISYLPPTENLPIFDSSVFPITDIKSSSASSDPTKLDYPTAQGAESFPSGLTTTQINKSPNGGYVGQTISTTLSGVSLPAGGFASQYFTQKTSIPNAGVWLVMGYVSVYGSSATNMTWNGFSWSGSDYATINFGSSFTSALSAPNTYNITAREPISTAITLASSLTYPVVINYEANAIYPSINLTCGGTITFTQIA
jgi:hypothetical protein